MSSVMWKVVDHVFLCRGHSPPQTPCFIVSVQLGSGEFGDRPNLKLSVVHPVVFL